MEVNPIAAKAVALEIVANKERSVLFLVDRVTNELCGV